MPKVSICIPTYNRQDLLPFAIDSVLQQSFQDWELLVCDDGSSDQTPEVMAGYSDPRIRYIRHPRNIGKSNNMRSGFEVATGTYFIKFDDDDRLTSKFLTRTVAILDGRRSVGDHREPTIDFVGTDHWLIDRNNQRQIAATETNSKFWGRTLLSEGVVEDLLTVVFLQQSFQIGATLFRRSALETVNFMRPNLRNCEDNDLFVRLALAGKTGYYLPERLMEYRVHAEQQGLDRAIPYLEDKIAYLNGFEFDSETLEQVRQSRLKESQLLLGLRLIQVGERQRGRTLIQASCQGTGRWLKASSPKETLRERRPSPKATIGLLLSYFPSQWVRQGFALLRHFKP
jgi:glycosyltransferase involved in cell wall biosynthesis